MKFYGSRMAFVEQRNEALLKTYRRVLGEVPFIRSLEVARLVADSPAPRFWVSEQRAATVVSAMMRGRPVLDSMLPTKREMFQEIHRRVLELRAVRPDWCLAWLVTEVVNSPAPKFYMEAGSVIQYLCRIRRRNARSRK